MRHPYKNHIIDVRTPDLPDNGGWRSLVSVERHEDSQTVMSGAVPIPELFKTQEEAEEAGVSFGKSKIDSL